MDFREVAERFAAEHDLPDWRVLLDRIESTFVAGSFTDAAALIGQIAAAADAADHHPDIDLRHPAVVHVALTTHAAGGLSRRDATLAHQISQLADAAGVKVEPTSATMLEIAIDALDIAAVQPFWAAVLGYREVPPAHCTADLHRLVDPRHLRPAMWFQQMSEPRAQRNRVHLDLDVAEDVVEQRIAAALAAGGRLVTDEFAPAWWVLADTEGNEICLCTWRPPR
jgi:4a-hydroxytetrahydrobiopterin dehydratase